MEARFSGHRFSGKPRFKGHSSKNLSDHFWYLVHKSARNSGKSRFSGQNFAIFKKPLCYNIEVHFCALQVESFPGKTVKKWWGRHGVLAHTWRSSRREWRRWLDVLLMWPSPGWTRSVSSSPRCLSKCQACSTCAEGTHDRCFWPL